MKLTHPGVSNYKFKGRNYAVNFNVNDGEKLFLKYQYGNITRENSNDSFRKLAANRPVLSPFTSWDIRLEPIFKSEADSRKLVNQIAELISDKEQIMVYLIGNGQYVDDDFRTPMENCV